MSNAVECSLVLGSRRNTLRLAHALAKYICAGDLVVLTGELGAGKTFFVRGVCRALGLSERVRVTSPTFTLVHELNTLPPLLHVDLYRIETSREVEQLGLLSRRDEGHALFVEWGEPWIAELGGDALVLALSAHPRAARFTCCGVRSCKLLAQLKESGQMKEG
jgi:tRNA threonylcarbamoyladenosine biosynthesis protein TsaE